MNKQTLVIIGGVAVGLYLLDRLTRIADINKDTPFENTGIVGTLGNVTDKASGGILSKAGSAIGEFFSGGFFDRRTIDELTQVDGPG